MADSKSGQMEMPQLDQGLSPLGENDSSYPLPYFTDSKEQRYTSLLMKLSCIKPDHGVENISDNLVKEPPDSSAFLDEYLFNENNLRRVALLLKHIINLDELDQFVLFLDALREDTSTQTCSLFGKAETQFSELCERAKTMLESLKSKDERFPDLVTEIGVILDIFNNMKQNMTKKRGFFETTLSVQDNLVKCSDYMSLILDAKSLIEANNCLLAIYRINHIKTQLHLLQLPEKLTNLIVEYLFILQEDAQKKSKKSLKNFVENSHVLCRTIAEKISPDNKSNPCAFHEVELHPYVSSERDAPLFIEGCNFRNGKIVCF